MSHIVQGCNSRCMMRFSTFFPFLLVFLVVTIVLVMGFILDGMVVTISLTGEASSGVRGINPVEVMPVTPVVVGGTKYQTGIAKDMFGNTTVAKTCCDTKLGGGYRKGVWEMA